MSRLAVVVLPCYYARYISYFHMNKREQRQQLIPTQFKNEEAWVEYYVKSHVSDDIRYRESYVPYMVLDRLMDKYDLLEIGCGTAGYIKLLPNLKHFVGIDWSGKMVDAAKLLNPQHEFIQVLFDDYKTEHKFDAIIDSVTGIYDRPKQKNIDKIFSLLKDGGIAVISVRSPKISLKEKCGDIVRRRESLKVPEMEMHRMFAKFRKMFKISKRSGSIDVETYFLEKSQ